jgi:Glycosyltransferase family 87
VGSPRPRRRYLLITGALVVAVALSVAQGMQEHVGRDFHVFWQAGRNFASGSPLYHDYLPGARHFKYPPFAAFVFQVLALFPLQVAAALFSLLNLVLWAAAVYLTRDIVDRTFPERNTVALPLVLAVVFSAQFFLDNFHHAQVNGLILVLILLGVRAYLSGKDLVAAAYLVTATAIKITPVFFVAWLVARGGRRVALAVPAIAIACVLLPLLVRGPTTGASELVEYYHSFLQGHQQGNVTNYTSYIHDQNLAALVNRMSGPPHPQLGSYRYLPASQHTAQLIYRALWTAVLLGFLVKLALLRIRRAPLSAFELSMVFVTGLLLSPITLTAHFVSMIFVFHTIMSVRVAPLSIRGRVVLGALWVAMAVTGLSGRDLVGRTAYLSVRGYSIFVWMLLLLFVLALVLAGRRIPDQRGSLDSLRAM